MTLEEFTALRRDELVVFFKARFGRHWRRSVAIQARMHPRWLERWSGLSPLSLYRQIHKLEWYARTAGFQSATDAKVQEALRADEQFKQSAAQSSESCKRNQAERAREDVELRQETQRIEAAMREAVNNILRKATPVVTKSKEF